MTPGHINGVRIIWPEPGQVQQPVPQPKRPYAGLRKEACLRGHVGAERNSAGACVICGRERAKEWARKKKRESRQKGGNRAT